MWLYISPSSPFPFRAEKKVKTQHKSVLYKGNKEHGLDIYMRNFSEFQNTVMTAHKQLTTVSTSAVTAAAALLSRGFGGTLLPPRGHSSGRKARNVRDSDKSLSEESCNRRQQGAGRDQSKTGLTTFLGRITYKSKQNPSTLKSSYASEKTATSSWQDKVRHRQERRASTVPCCCPLPPQTGSRNTEHQ